MQKVVHSENTPSNLATPPSTPAAPALRSQHRFTRSELIQRKYHRCQSGRITEIPDSPNFPDSGKGSEDAKNRLVGSRKKMRLQLMDSDRVGKRLSICVSTTPVCFILRKSLLSGVLLRGAGRCPLGEQSPGRVPCTPTCIAGALMRSTLPGDLDNHGRHLHSQVETKASRCHCQVTCMAY